MKRVSLAEVLIVVAIVATIILIPLFNAVQCGVKAKALGLEWSWGPIQGCIVTRQDGVKVEIQNYGRADRD